MSKRKRLGLGVASGLGVLILYLLAWPVPIDPVPWTPPAKPDWPVNDRLAQITSVGVPLGAGPEDVAVDAQGRVVVSLANGKIVRFAKDGSTAAAIADTGGRPLGLAFDSAGVLWICDSLKGLLSLSTDGALHVASTGCDGIPFRCTNDVDVAKDGTVYFTDATSKFPVMDYTLDLLEHGPNGRLLSYDPKTKVTKQLIGGLSFPNGVALAGDDSFVLMAETGTYCVHRYWLKGPKAGTREPIMENLPGFPDGISRGTNGLFWLAIASPRDTVLDAVLPSPFLRKVICRFPKFLQPAAQRHAFVLGIDADGKVLHDLQHRAPDSLSPVTSVEEHGGKLYLGTLHLPRYGTVPVPADK